MTQISLTERSKVSEGKNVFVTKFSYQQHNWHVPDNSEWQVEHCFQCSSVEHRTECWEVDQNEIVYICD